MAWVFLILTFLAALVEWMAVARDWRKVEFIAKPLVIIFLLLWLVFGWGLGGGLNWFALGLFFSLIGDVILLFPNEDRWFLFGMVAFLLTHAAYFAGLNTPPPSFNGITLGVAIMIILTALPVVRRILQGAVNKGLTRLIVPIRIYAVLISLMLFSALLTLFRTDWSSGAAYLVSSGAVLFLASDMLLAWEKFVQPVRRGRLLVMISYSLGQIALTSGAALQFAHYLK